MPTMTFATQLGLAQRQFELDIDLKIIRAARHGLPLTYTCYQEMRERVLGQKLNIRCNFDPQAKKFEQEISRLR